MTSGILFQHRCARAKNTPRRENAIHTHLPAIQTLQPEACGEKTVDMKGTGKEQRLCVAGELATGFPQTVLNSAGSLY